jgi:hypothetical protein
VAEDPLARQRLDQHEELIKAFGPAVTQVAVAVTRLDDVITDVHEDREANREFRREVRDALKELRVHVDGEFAKVRGELRDDRKESRNRTLLALSPLGLAALALAARALGIEVPIPGAW